MKASDYIVEFLIQNGITDVFGYPGGMVTHLMDSLDRYRENISAHVNYHEQACAMAACGWAEITGLPGVAYATSGPGATNLLTGIACAYFESLPCLFITGQVNTYEQKGILGVRQRGFQETDIVSMAKPVTKNAFMVTEASQLPGALERAWKTAMSGRRGPVLLDIPMNVFRGEVAGCPAGIHMETQSALPQAEAIASEILSVLRTAKRPLILAGHGIALSSTTDAFRSFVNLTGIPTTTSMIAVDALPSDSPLHYGMIGAYGTRIANFLIDHSDCILTLGSRLDCRQTGVNKALFAPKAQILRVDIDAGELENRTNEQERQYVVPLQTLLPALRRKAENLEWDFSSWRNRCERIRRKLAAADNPEPGNLLAEKLGNLLPDGITVTTDVGQNQVWIAQSMSIKPHQRVLFSGGHGAMGYSLPAAIGAAVATKKPVVCCVGDGGFQMNIQELEFIAREKLPVKIVLMNNHALGMIHHFQEMYFNSNYMQTDDGKGFTVPDFARIAAAYGIRVVSALDTNTLSSVFADDNPVFIELCLPQTTHVFPKLGLNKPIHQQEPPLAEDLMEELVQICLDGR
ncbi:thiamine pyrophosphate-binding protein [Oscillibacter valericigenes]|uniref:thiamine pyrophosphate-binding protein n=1 Tax=Oscillibacter valericigenes TaxID=351091 RepID=UPI001F424D96|nr:thiamine pyrophosphate-binding protein [Oscillibacter valericigenes]MCF2617859.1 thiamine pyrophosphate-binding protein [Oscillibacter valericigenes]